MNVHFFFGQVFSSGFFFFFSGFRTDGAATSVCTTGCVHTLTCRTHIFLRTAHSQRISHIFMRVHIHAWLRVMKKVGCMCVIPLHLAFSVPCFTHLCCSCTVTSRPLLTTNSLRISSTDFGELARHESAGHAPLRTSIAKFGYLAKSDENTGLRPSFCRKFEQTLTRCGT